MKAAVAISAWLAVLASPASAQVPAPGPETGASSAAPDEGWQDFGAGRAPVAPGSPSPLPPPPPPPSAPLPAAAVTAVPEPEPEFNTVSMYGAPSLGQWKRGAAIYLGFPLLGVRAALGVLPQADAGLAFDSLYGIMNDIRAHAKWQFFGNAHWSAAVAAEGGLALFSQSPQAETHGARWFTGRRNWNLAPGLVVSYRGDSPHSARLFADVRVALAFDTEPYARFPLSGVPANVQVSPNLPVRLGAEMPFSPRTSFLFMFGFDLHGRSEDSSFMIAVSVGIVTSV